MSRQLIATAAIVAVFAGAAHAQVIGDSPNAGLGAAVRASPGIFTRSHGPESSWPDYEGERQYREALKKIPNRKPANDPWAKVRQAPASSVDRHRVQ